MNKIEDKKNFGYRAYRYKMGYIINIFKLINYKFHHFEDLYYYIIKNICNLKIRKFDWMSYIIYN